MRDIFWKTLRALAVYSAAVSILIVLVTGGSAGREGLLGAFMIFIFPVQWTSFVAGINRPGFCATSFFAACLIALVGSICLIPTLRDFPAISKPEWAPHGVIAGTLLAALNVLWNHVADIRKQKKLASSLVD